MSPLLEHEEYKGFIHDLVRVLSEELSISLETRGSATFKAKQKGTGVEPDDCFYVQNAFRIIGKREIDLSVDPPPDVAVEIDVTSESLSKFPIYAALGVLELWRYDGQYAQIYELAAQTYSEVAASRFFPLITAAVLGQFIEESKTDGQSAVLVRFREWVRASQT